MPTEEGCYIYGIIGTSHRREFGPLGIGGRGDSVYTLPYQNIAAIISSAPITKYPVTRENMLTHSRVLEKAAEEATVLPVRYSTLAENEEMIIEKLLKTRYQEFIDLLQAMTGKRELGMRARWKDLNATFAELVEENRNIKALKEASLNEKNEQRQYASKIKIGELVQQALAEKKKREARELIQALRPLSLDYREKEIYGDMNIVNAAFLVEKEKERAFDQKINELETMDQERKQLKYTTTAVPYSFVELVVYW